MPIESTDKQEIKIFLPEKKKIIHYYSYVNKKVEDYKQFFTLCGCSINTKSHKYNGVKYNIHINLLLIVL